MSEVPLILNKRRFTAKNRSLTDERRSGAYLKKATVPGRVDLSVNRSTYFIGFAPRSGAIFLGDVIQPQTAPFSYFCRCGLSVCGGSNCPFQAFEQYVM